MTMGHWPPNPQQKYTFQTLLDEWVLTGDPTIHIDNGCQVRQKQSTREENDRYNFNRLGHRPGGRICRQEIHAKRRCEILLRVRLFRLSNGLLQLHRRVRLGRSALEKHASSHLDGLNRPTYSSKPGTALYLKFALASSRGTTTFLLPCPTQFHRRTSSWTLTT